LLASTDNSLSPSFLHIFALTLGFSTGLMKICCREKILESTRAALESTVIRFIPRGIQIVIRNQKIIRSASLGDLDIGSVANNPHLLSSDYSVDLLYETIAFQTFEAIITFLCVNELKPYLDNRKFFGEIPLSMSILHLILEFRNNQNIQRQGLYILCYFARSGVETSIVIDKSAEALACIISGLKRDSEVVSQFLYMISIIILSKWNPSNEKSDYFMIQTWKLEIYLIDLIIGNHINAEDIVSALTSFMHLTNSPSTCNTISTNSKGLSEALIRVLESPNTNLQMAVIAAMTGFTNLFHNEAYPESTSPFTKRLLKAGKTRLLKMIKSDEAIPENFDKKSIEKLIGKCSKAEKCSIS
jgi:hypothetical protein